MNKNPDPEKDIEIVKSDRDRDSFAERWSFWLILALAIAAIVWALL